MRRDRLPSTCPLFFNEQLSSPAERMSASAEMADAVVDRRQPETDETWVRRHSGLIEQLTYTMLSCCLAAAHPKAEAGRERCVRPDRNGRRATQVQIWHDLGIALRPESRAGHLPESDRWCRVNSPTRRRFIFAIFARG